uniref:Uncharacterized protein n=1 Tax=Anguilla anguilla TaxID=7936 RepID=A0A0E9U7C6_ANGAN
MSWCEIRSSKVCGRYFSTHGRFLDFVLSVDAMSCKNCLKIVLFSL